MKYISGIQQIGIGVSDVYEGWSWYRKNFGFDVPVFDDPGTAALMLPYTGNSPQKRHAVLAINMQGGGGFEIWQYTSRVPQAPTFDVLLGDLGIYTAKIKTNNIEKTYENFINKSIKVLGELHKDPSGNSCFYVEDPYGNIFQIVASNDVFLKTSSVTGGAYGVFVGVTDMEKSIQFYKEILDYDQVVYDKTGIFEDFEALPGGKSTFRRVLLAHSKARKGPFSQMLGKSMIELVQVIDRKPNKIYKDRYWGDLGFIHLCFDVQGMKNIKASCEKLGCPFTVDSNPDAYSDGEGTFDMGEASGHFTYTEDPDGALIEFVETHKIPILKKLGWYLDLKRRKPDKPLPRFMLRAIGLNRVKD